MKKDLKKEIEESIAEAEDMLHTFRVSEKKIKKSGEINEKTENLLAYIVEARKVVLQELRKLDTAKKILDDKEKDNGKGRKN